MLDVWKQIVVQIGDYINGFDGLGLNMRSSKSRFSNHEKGCRVIAKKSRQLGCTIHVNVLDFDLREVWLPWGVIGPARGLLAVRNSVTILD